MQHRRGALLVALALAVTGVFVAVTPQPAQALTTEKATARPNEDGGDGVIGGMDTRLTWEGTVEPGEEVTSVTLRLPEGASFDGSTTRITALEGLKRMDVTGEAAPPAAPSRSTSTRPFPRGRCCAWRSPTCGSPPRAGSAWSRAPT